MFGYFLRRFLINKEFVKLDTRSSKDQAGKVASGAREGDGQKDQSREKSASKRNKVNDEIRHRELRLIGASGEQIGIMSAKEAMVLAAEATLDLVEIAPDAVPPVCRIMNYGKFLFEEKKKKADSKKKQKQVQIKEIKIRPATGEADYQVKLKALKRFLEEGDKAKITLKFKGREASHQELAEKLLKRIEVDLTEFATLEQEVKDGKQMMQVYQPKKKK